MKVPRIIEAMDHMPDAQQQADAIVMGRAGMVLARDWVGLGLTKLRLEALAEEAKVIQAVVQAASRTSRYRQQLFERGKWRVVANEVKGFIQRAKVARQEEESHLKVVVERAKAEEQAALHRGEADARRKAEQRIANMQREKQMEEMGQQVEKASSGASGEILPMQETGRSIPEVPSPTSITLTLTRCQCFNTNTQNKLASCGTPSFPDGNVMHEKFLTGFKHWTLQKLGWHNTQVMPNPKPAMGDSTLHSVSVVAVVSERQGENHFSLNQNPIAQPDCAR